MISILRRWTRESMRLALVFGAVHDGLVGLPALQILLMRSVRGREFANRWLHSCRICKVKSEENALEAASSRQSRCMTWTLATRRVLVSAYFSHHPCGMGSAVG